MNHQPNYSFFKQLCFGLVFFCCLFHYIKSGTELYLKSVSNDIGNKGSFLIDDFSNSTGESAFGTQWRFFSDQVMGGISTGTSGYETIKGRSCLRLQGSVSLENNGGFIQVALSLVRKDEYFNAETFQGVRLQVLGNGETYHIHLRSNQTRRPWQYFAASFSGDDKWQTIDIPFRQFKPENLAVQLDPSSLSRIAIVAIKKEFQADIAVARLGFYR